MLSNFSVRNQWAACGLAILATVCLVSTIFFAFNSSLEIPHIPSLVAQNPAQTILILNIMSQITAFALAELTRWIMNDLRWVIATTETGISALSFLVLSKATTIFGTFLLTFTGGDKQVGSGHRLLGLQRFVPAQVLC